jgi:hypothetical protein
MSRKKWGKRQENHKILGKCVLRGDLLGLTSSQEWKKGDIFKVGVTFNDFNNLQNRT